MEGSAKEKGKGKKAKIDVDELIANKKFIKALAKEVKKALLV
jgi:hypothetical protein